jgi:hypothetical protein
MMPKSAAHQWVIEGPRPSGAQRHFFFMRQRRNSRYTLVARRNLATDATQAVGGDKTVCNAERDRAKSIKN